MAALYGWHNRKTARPDNGRTAGDRRIYRVRSVELSALVAAHPELLTIVSEYREAWRRSGNLASFPNFQDWFATRPPQGAEA